MLQIELWKRIVIWGLVALGLLMALPNGFYSRVETHNDAVAAIEAGAESAELTAQAGAWPGWMPSGLVNLGLDLRGGAHLLAEVQVADVYQARVEGMWPEVRDLLREERATIGPIRLQPTDAPELRVRLVEKPDQVEEAAALVRGLARPVTTLTGVGASDIDVTTERDQVIVRLSEAEQLATDERTVRQALEIIRRRIDEVGTREPTIQRQGADRILIQVPGVGSAAELKEIIGTTAQLTFQPVVSRTSNGAENPGAGNEVLPSLDEEGQFYILEKAAVVTGECLVDAQPDFDQNGRPAVSFRFNPTGAGAYSATTPLKTLVIPSPSCWTARSSAHRSSRAISQAGRASSPGGSQSRSRPIWRYFCVLVLCQRASNSLKNAPLVQNWALTVSRRARWPVSWPSRWCWSSCFSATAPSESSPISRSSSTWG